MKVFWYCDECDEEVEAGDIDFMQQHKRCGNCVRLCEILEDEDLEDACQK